MIFWVTVKKNLMKGGKKMLNIKLECHIIEPHVLQYEVSTLYIYIYILIIFSKKSQNILLFTKVY